MLSQKQKSLYWRTWSKVRKTYVELGGFSASDADAQRQELHLEALGKNKSSKDLNNRDFDAILDHFQAVLVLVDGPRTGPSRTELQPVKRLVHAIQTLGLPEPYIEAISRAEFQTSDWRNLTESELTKLRFTLTSRARARRNR